MLTRKTTMTCFSPFSSFVTYFVISLAKGKCFFRSASLSLEGDNSLVHEPKEWWQRLSDTFQCNILCPTSCIEISWWGNQSVVGVKFFSSYSIMSLRVLEIPKQVTWIASMWHLSRKKHWLYVMIEYLHHFYFFYHYNQI